MRDTIIDHYLIAALWSSIDDHEDPLDKNYSTSDIETDSLVRVGIAVDKFIKKAGPLLEGLDLEHVGHDFWLTRNGHGAGFWDGDYEKELGKKLTEISKEFGASDMYVGDDGLLYITGDDNQ